MKTRGWAAGSTAVLMTAAAGAMLSGCSPQPAESIAAFDRAQAAADQIPAGLDPLGDLGIAADSSRLLLDQAGVQYFAAHSAPGDGICLVVYSSPTEWTGGCSTGLPIWVELEGVADAELNSFTGTSSSDEWQQVADNLALRR